MKNERTETDGLWLNGNMIIIMYMRDMRGHIGITATHTHTHWTISRRNSSNNYSDSSGIGSKNRMWQKNTKSERQLEWD